MLLLADIQFYTLFCEMILLVPHMKSLVGEMFCGYNYKLKI